MMLRFEVEENEFCGNDRYALALALIHVARSFSGIQSVYVSVNGCDPEIVENTEDIPDSLLRALNEGIVFEKVEDETE